MKILLVSQYFWPESFRVNDLVRAWQERGHRVTVLTGIPNYPEGRPYTGYSAFGPAAERFGDSRVVRVPLLPRGRGNRLRLAVNYLSFALSASLLGPVRCRGRFDCVFVYQLSPVTVGIPGAVLRRLRGVPMALWVQDLWPETLTAIDAVRSPLLLGIVRRLVRWIYRRCDLLLVQSRGFVSAVEKCGADPVRVRHLPNWSESFYRPVEVAADAPERAALPRGFVALFAGNLGDAQSLETILEAAERLRDAPQIQWVLLGEGSRRRWLEREISRRRLGESVHWLGAHPAESMPRWLCAADALVITLRAGDAISRTVPTKLQSYMACGRPILGALDGEGADIVRHAGAGLIGPAGDAAELAANALALAGRSAADRAAMGRAGREYFLGYFEREALVGRLETWLEELTAANGQR